MNFLDNILKNIDETVNKALSPLNNSDDNTKTYQLNWQPQAGKQQLAFTLMTDTASDIYNIGYGGARGCGKTELGINTALTLMYELKADFNGLYLRNTSASLVDIIDRFIKALARDNLQKGKDYSFNSQKNIFKLSNGAILRFYHVENNGLINLQGSNISHCFLEEPQYFVNIKDSIQPAINAMMRSTSSTFNTKVFWFFNPKGPSTKFLKDYFVKHKHNNVYYDEKEDQKRIFIQANIQDNQLLLQNDPNYLKNLEALPEHIKKAWLDGSFDIKAGLAFDTLTKANNSFKDASFRPDDYPWFIALDWGFTDKSAVGFYCLYKNTILIKFDELIFSQRTPFEASMIIKQKMNNYNNQTFEYGVADTSIWSETQGKSIAYEMQEHGLYFKKATKDRETGFLRLYSLIKNKQILFYDNLKFFWDSVPNLIIDENKTADIASKPKQDDHVYDETRYMVMALPFLNKTHESSYKQGSLL